MRDIIEIIFLVLVVAALLFIISSIVKTLFKELRK